MSQLETIANELLFDIFEFLNTAHLLHAFLDLNSRFNQLIYAHFQNHQFNLRSIGKQDFDMICQQHLSILIDNIISFHLTNDDETPDLYELFFSYHFSLDQFIRLTSLSLSYIDSFDTIHEIILQCRALSYLQKLYLIDCHIHEQGKHTAKMINNIWSLPNLRHCVMNNVTVDMTWIYQVTIISSTLEYLSIKMIAGDKSALYYLCKSAPRLQRLNIDVIHWSLHSQPKILFPSLMSLKTSFEGPVESTIEFLKSLPNLRSLTVEISDISVNGYDWQTFLVNYLAKLEIFRLKMNFTFLSNGNLITSIDQLVDSYRTDFWMKEHQWYIRCDCYFSKHNYAGVLYTLPYRFKQCSYLNTYYSISTKPNDDELHSYNHVQFVDPQIMQIDSFQNFKLFNIRFPNIHHLEMILPLIDHSDYFSTLSFNQLTSITVILNDLFSYHQLQTLINRTCTLYSLKLMSFGGSIEALFQLTSSSIRRLDLIVAQIQNELFFNHENCINLSHSPLGCQCEVLVIGLESRNDILDLIEKISHLRVLIFRLQNDDLCNDGIFVSKYRKLMRWLERNISPKCSIHLVSNQESTIGIWISRERDQSFLMKDVPLISNNRLHVRENSSRGYLYLLILFASFLLSCYLFNFYILQMKI